MEGRLLVVDDEPGVRSVLKVTLSNAGHTVFEAGSGEEALRLIREASFDLLLLDSNLPGLSGKAVCRELRRRAVNIPILMLTVLDSEHDKIEALTAGVDDYVTKPFSLGELTARVHALLRRSHMARMTEEISVGSVTLNAADLSCSIRGKSVKLTPTQFKVMERLVVAGGKTVPNRVLLSSVWGSESRDRIEYLRVFIRQLRMLIEDDPSHPTALITVPHIGYRYNPQTASGSC